ncbi:MAG: PAS domain S-box protein, partial [Cytophagales bacterium]|nr:PAS domain S-box protein [Cytophagales bacterium]
MGYAPEEVPLSQEWYYQQIHPEDVPLLTAEGQKPLDQRAKYIDYRLRHKDGTYRWVRASSLYEFSQEGQLLRHIGAMTDITVTKDLEDALKTSEIQFREIVNLQNQLITRWNPRTLQRLFVNDYYRQYFGYPMEVPASELDITHVSVELLHQIADGVMALSPEQPLQRHEDQLVNASGEPRWMEWTDKAVFDNHGQVVEVVSVGRDIHDQKLAETALEESERRYRYLFENTGIPIVHYDQEGHILLINNLAAQHMQSSPQQLVGRNIRDIFPEEMAHKFLERIRSCVHEDRPIDYEDSLPGPEGATRYFTTRTMPVKDGQGRVSSVQVIAQEMTD